MVKNMSESLAQRFRKIAELYPDLPALMSKNGSDTFHNITYSKLLQIVENFAKGLVEIGIKKNDHAAIISDNRKEWIISDLALLSIGAVDVPRGSDSTDEEIAYILEHSDSKLVFAENKAQYEKILLHIKRFKKIENIIIFEDFGKMDMPKKIKVYTYKQIMDLGTEKMKGNAGFLNELINRGKGSDLATIIYTSGTTGEPKGVMLTHEAFLFQVDRVEYPLNLKPGQIMLSVLPIWHSFERAVEYVLLFHGIAIAYSKPIGAVMLPDMAKIKPQWLASVPRIWEGVRAAVYRNVLKESAVKRGLFKFFVKTCGSFAYFRDMFLGRLPYFKRRIRPLDILAAFFPFILLSPLKFLGSILVFKKIKKKLGGKFVAGISGGGALPAHVDNFFRAAGILLLEGYGLTETGPILNVRDQNSPVPGTVGPFLHDIDFKIIDKEGSILPPGKKGVLCIRSVQVMQEYYKRPEATEAVLKNKWLNTGDICVLTYKGELNILGREKETIVLLGGENIEPVPIEDKLKETPLIDQIVIVGQDRKFLAALIVPDFEELKNLAENHNVSWVDISELCSNPEIQNEYHDIIQSLVNQKTGFKHFEHIYRFTLIPKEFEESKELTHSLKVRRNYVFDKYSKEINKLFS